MKVYVSWNAQHIMVQGIYALRDCTWFAYWKVHIIYTCYIWLDSEDREHLSSTKIIFIALSMQKLLTQSVQPTQCE